MTTIISNSEATPIKLKGTECLIHQRESLSQHTSYRVGGNAQLYSEPKSWDDIQALF